MRRSSLVLFLVVVATLGAVFPASAGNSRVEGPRVKVYGAQEDPLPSAGEAFHVRHGFGHDPSIHAPDEVGFGTRTFLLEVTDLATGLPVGVPSGSVVIVINRAAEDGKWKEFNTLYAFSNGLPAGDYEFTGHWYQPCAAGDRYNWDACGESAGPPSEVFTWSREVTIEDS